MGENSSELEATPLEPNWDVSPSPDKSTDNDAGAENSVEFSTDDTNHDYAKGLFMRHARELQAVFVEQYRQDPSARFRLTLERL